MYTNMQHFVARAKKELALANGRRRERLCDFSDVEQAILEALRGKEGLRVGGTVAHAYKYPAWTTHVYAKNCDRSPRASDGWGILVMIGVSDAHRDRQRRYGVEIRISRKVAQQIRANYIARERAKHTETIAQIPNVQLTRELSLRAGNCPQETDRVAAWFPGRDMVSAREVAEEAVRRGEYTLLRYIKRAAETAAA